MKGTVKFFNEDKGFGFIKGENGTEYLMHKNGLIDDVRENDEVQFELEQNKAVEVTLDWR